MDVQEAILRRRSIREFNDKPITDESIRELLESAMAAPSARNMQPWEFFVIKNKSLQKQLRDVLPNANMNSLLIIIVAGNDQRGLTHQVNDYWIQDCSAAIENMLLTATSIGIASCWCGLFPIAERVEKVKEILGTADGIIPMALIHLGYGDAVAAPRTQYDEKRIHLYEETDKVL